ncbi:MAG: T9SS type A sorting domain-containing protein [Bacteroidales bacterium]|nr:T9SS type A sorting domain-containing protein [Bacteroidales bacterium]
MLKGIRVFLLLLFVSPEIFYAQQLSHQVMVPAAGVISSGSLNYSQTIGETAIEIIGGQGYVFTQGFQQPGIKISDEIIDIGNGVNVYPNPATDYISVKFFGEVARNFKIEVITITGLVVSSGTIRFIEKYAYIQQISVMNLKPGFYLIRVKSDDGVINRTFKIEKM